MYILPFTLRQHTPLIHFQHEQEGATLRASEVKPKLDKFLIAKMGGRERMNKTWFINEQKDALRYKIHVEQQDVPRKIRIKLVTEEEIGLLHSKEINLYIKTEIKELLQEIKNNISTFFIRHNFGKRQSKGLGSFTTKNVTGEEFASTLLSFNTDIYLYNENLNNPDDFYTTISRKWRTLKSGTQIGSYIKSKLFKYMADNGHRWEKRLIKVCITDNPTDFPYALLNTNGHKPIDASYEGEDDYFGWDDNHDVDFDYFFVRALLGLPELYEFRTTDRDIVYQVLIKAKDGVQRFKSPVTFKVFENKIYAIIETIPEAVYGSKFDFEVIIKKGESKSKPISLYTDLPIPPYFELNHFLSIYFKTVGFNKL